MKKLIPALLAPVLVLSFAGPLYSEEGVSPYRLSDGAKVQLTGQVTRAKASTFSLDYGKGSITVELDDYDTYEEGFNIVDGDLVIVDGRIDADPGKTRTIEARSVYIPALDLRVEANAADEEDTKSKLFTEPLNDGTEVALNGIIKSIDRKVVTIQSSKGLVEIHFGRLQKQERLTLKIGQAVKVTGTFKNRLFRKDMIFAEQVERLQR